jgi:hypothetical protein
MSRCKLTVQGRGPDGLVTFSVEEYQGKVWITSYDRPFTCEAILDPARADSVIHLITQTTKEARGYRR